ncbi:MAG: hypothetical protein U1C51_08530 [Candidatus Izemoplasmatales bacterium]|nr:hypothetical protein [Candidatus Izemoplasmatales bacterium]
MTEKEILNRFELYLESQGYSVVTPQGLPSTTYDYAHARIPFVLREEQISVQTLMNDIDQYVKLYDFRGLKSALGNKSHRAVINALKRFQEFLTDQS